MKRPRSPTEPPQDPVLAQLDALINGPSPAPWLAPQPTDLPPVDLLIRTSGEVRLSNFLLWQMAYAEMIFVETLWPDFTPEHLKAALSDFAKRERRYGGR